LAGIDVYDLPIKWTAVFPVKNVLFESEMKFSTMVAQPDKEATNFSVEFSTDTTDERVAKEEAFMLFNGLKAILELEIGKPCLIEPPALEIINLGDIKGHASFKVLSGESFYNEMLLKSVKVSKENMERIKKIYEYLYPVEFRAVTFDEADLQYSVLTMLHWYGRAIEERTRGDQLIALWISFNAIYSFVWRRDHEEPGRPDQMTMARHLVKSYLPKSDECEEIIKRHQYIVYKAMPEPGEKEYLISEFGKDWKKYCNNPYGFDFWKQHAARRWTEALCEMIAFIYGVRNGLFHGKWLPNDSELMSESVFTLHDVVSLVLKRLIENTIAKA